MLTYLSRTSMVNKNNRKELQLTSNSARQIKAFYSVQMLLREVSTSPRLIGSFSLIPLMIQMITFIELVEQEEDLKVAVRPSYSS